MSSAIEHPALQGFDGAETVLGWSQLEELMNVIYSGRTDRPSYPSLF